MTNFKFQKLGFGIWNLGFNCHLDFDIWHLRSLGDIYIVIGLK